MKIKFEKSKMLEKLSYAMCATSNKNTIVSIEGVLIETVDERTVKVSTFDMEKGVRALVDAEVVSKGSYIINAQRFFSIIKAMPSGIITLTVNEDLIVEISAGKSSFSLHSLPGKDFPAMPELSGNNSFTIEQKVLKEIIARVNHSVAIADQRPMLCGAYFKISDDKIKVVSCDSFTLSLCEYKCSLVKMIKEADMMQFIVPGKALIELSRMLSDEENKFVTVMLTRKHIIFNLDNLTFFTRLIEGEYIDYNRIIPKDQPTRVTVNRIALCEALERAALVSEDKIAGSIKSYVKLNFDGNEIKISSTSPNGNVYEEISCTHTGENMEIGFNCRYLIDSIKVCDGENIELALLTPLMSMTIEAVEEEADRKNLFMILPVRMKE